MAGDNLPTEIAQVLNGPIAVNSALPVAQYKGLFSLQPDQPLSGDQGFSPYNVWYERNGGRAERNPPPLYTLSTDAAQTNSEAVLETTQLGLYRPGATVNASAGNWMDVEPRGDAFYDVGYFRDSGTEGIYFRITEGYDLNYRVDSERYPDGSVHISQDEMKRGEVTEKTRNGEVVGRVYGLDRYKNNGPGVASFDGSVGHVLGQTLGWYGPSSLMGWYLDIGDVEGNWVQKVWPLFLFRPVGGPALRDPNQPVSVRVNNGTSGQALEMRVGGRQFATQGEVPPNPSPTFHYADLQTIPWDSGTASGNWNISAVIKRKAGDEGTTLGMNNLQVGASNEPTVFQTRVVEETDITGTFDYGPPTGTAPDKTAITIDCASDTPDRLTLDTKTLPDGTVVPAGDSWSGGLGGTVSNTGNETAGGTAVDEIQSLAYPFVRDHPTVILTASRSSADALAEINLQISEMG